MRLQQRSDHRVWSERCERDGEPRVTGRAESPRSPFPARSYGERIRDLLLECGRGDVSALGRLYDETIAWVYPLACRVSPDTESATLLTKDAYQRMWTTSPRFDPGSTCAVSWVARQFREQLTAAGRDLREAGAPEVDRPLMDLEA